MSAHPAAARRFDRIDALRGFAIVWMALFHFSFDLNYFGLVPKQNFYHDPLWTWQRVAIVTLFLLCAGLGQAVALESDAPRWGRRFWQRWAQIAVCALLVSVGSWLMFPRSWISFGILHGIALMLVVLRLLAPLGRGLWLAGVVAIALPFVVQHPFFDTPLTNWVGLVTRKPVTEDYAPLLPWLGVMCFGLAAGRWLLERHRGWIAAPAPLGALGRGLAVLGRWSLSFYMVHQPVLIGLVMAFVSLRGAHP